jgi:hypothetical protein
MQKQANTGERSGVSVSRRQILKGAGAMLGASGVLAVLGAPATVLAEDAEQSLAGAWHEFLHQPGFGDFETLVTYDPGGGLVLTASIDWASGLKSSPTHGAWVHEAGRTFRWRGVAFSLEDSGNLNGIYDIKETLTLNHAGTTYSATGTVEIKPAGANPITVPLAAFTISAVRIKL